jgi:hypothetical protein
MFLLKWGANVLRSDVFWAEPVVVRLLGGANRYFRSVHDTLDFLQNEWPVRGGSSCHEAARCCEAALMKAQSPEHARRLFVIACAEVGFEICNERVVRSSPRPSHNVKSLRSAVHDRL